MLLQARAEACAATVNGKIYVAGGEGSGGGLLSSIEVYTPSSNAWSKVADLPINVTDLGCTAFGNSGMYMAGGWTLSGTMQLVDFTHVLPNCQHPSEVCLQVNLSCALVPAIDASAERPQKRTTPRQDCRHSRNFLAGPASPSQVTSCEYFLGTETYPARSSFVEQSVLTLWPCDVSNGLEALTAGSNTSRLAVWALRDSDLQQC